MMIDCKRSGASGSCAEVALPGLCSIVTLAVGRVRIFSVPGAW
jgi:hypothetical protein